MSAKTTKVTQNADVHLNPHFDYGGKRHTTLHCEYVDAHGTHVTGNLDIQHILEAADVHPQPGDKLIVTVEVVHQGDTE